MGSVYMKVRNINSGEIYQVYGISGSGFSRWINHSSKIDRFLISDFGYKWVGTDCFELYEEAVKE